MSNQKTALRPIVAAIVPILWLTPAIGFAQAPNTGFSMKSADPVFQEQVIGPNSRAANAADWPSTFVFKNDVGAACTATAIGAETILTAAHCISDASTGTIQEGQSAAAVTCRHHPKYPADISADFSLCRIASPLSPPAEGFEVVNTNASSTPSGAQIKLLGFGCLTKGGADQSFGRLFEGDSKVISVERNDYIVTGGGAAVCFGDSGGGAYVTIDRFGLQRRLVAINSRGDISSYSWLSVTASPLFTSWARKWAADQQVAICGLDPSAQRCRQ